MADTVTMKVLDTFHMSNIQSDNLVAGDIITVTETDAKHLEKLGVAERGGTAAKAVNVDASPSDRADTREDLDAERGFEEGKAIGLAPANKMETAPANKTVSAASTPTRASRAKR